jgi:hypothetical protein
MNDLAKVLSVHPVKEGLSMPFKGEFIPPKKADLRIERLAVAIVKSKDLNDYFLDSSKMELVGRYLGINIPFMKNTGHIVEFLDSLYLSDSEMVRQLFQYVLNEILESRIILTASSQSATESNELVEVFLGFERFLRELNVLGFDYDIEKQEVIPTIGHTKQDIQIETELEGLLDKYNPKYRDMIRGAWESFLSHNPDKYRQAVTSLRELTRMVISQLAPDEKTRKDRIKKIIHSEKEEELADSIVKLQDLHSNKVHGEADYDSTLFTLKATEYLLFFLLKKIEKTSK